MSYSLPAYFTMETTSTTVYALDLPINETGGPQHVKEALGGAALPAANYSFTSLANNKVVYHVTGHGPMLIVASAPGWGVNINYLPNAMKPLVNSGRVTLVCVQPRGSSPSERPEDESKMMSRDMAEDIERLRQHLGREKISVLGHSNGAAIALAYATMFPEQCTNVVAISSQIIGYPTPEGWTNPAFERRKHDAPYADLMEIFCASRTGGMVTDEEATKWIAEVLPLYFTHPETNVPIFKKQNGTKLTQTWPSTQQNIVDCKPEAAFYKDLKNITAKVLLLSGDDDFVCSLASSKAALVAIGDNARHCVYESCGHMPWIEAEEAFFRDVKDFLFTES